MNEQFWARGTQKILRELNGTQRNSREHIWTLKLKGTQGNFRELIWTHRTQGNSRELNWTQRTQGNSMKLFWTHLYWYDFTNLKGTYLSELILAFESQENLRLLKGSARIYKKNKIYK